jgi:chaperonin cofactor prefoldin
MAREPSFVVDYLQQVETLAEDVLADRREIIELNKKRDKNREAMRSLMKPTVDKKVWLCSGNMFIKFSKNEATKILERGLSTLL